MLDITIIRLIYIAPFLHAHTRYCSQSNFIDVDAGEAVSLHFTVTCHRHSLGRFHLHIFCRFEAVVGLKNSLPIDPHASG